MIIRLTRDVPPELDDLDRLDRLHATCTGPLGEMVPGSLCHWDVDDADHVWLDIADARSTGIGVAGAGWGDRFDAMIEYAASKGWTDAEGSKVRAHVERA